MQRSTLIVGGIAIVVIGAGVLIFIYSNGNVPAVAPSAVNEGRPAAVAVPFTELTRGTQSDVKTRANYLVTSTEGLKKLWGMLDAQGKVPEVDFEKNSVVAVFAGENPTTGYAIEVSKIEDLLARTVFITLTKPDRSCFVGQTLTAPYQIVLVPVTELSFAHEDQTETKSCSN